MKILVTGGAGFVGSHVVDRCIEAGHQVAVVDDLSTGEREHVNAAARLHVADIRSPSLLDVFRSAKPDAVVHLAAQAAVSRSVEDPRLDADINVIGSINLLDCCRQVGARRFVYVSTGGAGYGDTGPTGAAVFVIVQPEADGVAGEVMVQTRAPPHHSL